LKAGDMTDTIRTSLEWILQQLIEAEATVVHGHEKVPAGGRLRSSLVATRSPRWWPAEVPTPH